MERLEAAKAVERMQNYIDAHLTERITLAQLAKAAGYSPFHCLRLFKEHLGKTPFDYIRALRLTKSALELRDGNRRVIDVAFDFVFDSHEGFTKAFSKQFGISPYRYKKQTPPIKLFMPYNARISYLTFNIGERKMPEKRQTVFVQVVERPKRKAMIMRGINAKDYYEYCEEVGCDVDGILTSVKEALYEPCGMWLPDKLIKQGTSKYVQGVELPLDFNNAVPEGFELITLEPCKLMVFQGEPFNDEDFEQAISDIWEHIDTFNPTVYGYEWADEDAPRIQLAPAGYRGYIEARPVRQIK